MRLIDADELAKKWTIASPEPYNTDAVEVLDSIREAPTVDAVVVTRCKDCKHKGWVKEPRYGKSFDYCSVWDCTLWNLESTFCSYGERKDGGNADENRDPEN